MLAEVEWYVGWAGWMVDLTTGEDAPPPAACAAEDDGC